MTVELLRALAARLQIRRPLVGLDLETTGKVPDVDRIIQIGIIRALPNGDVREWSTFVDPQIDIPAEATLAHKITNEMVAGSPTFGDLAGMLLVGLSDCDFLGQNLKFDLRFLEAEFKRANRVWSYAEAGIVDTLRIDQVKDPRDLSSLLKKYCDGLDHPEAHEALADVRAAIQVFDGELRAYPDLPQTVRDLHDLCWPRDPRWIDAAGKLQWRNGEASIAFGKQFNGRTLSHMAAPCHCDVRRHDRGCTRGYLEWMLTSDFPDDVKTIIRHALAGRFPVYVPPVVDQEAA